MRVFVIFLKIIITYKKCCRELKNGKFTVSTIMTVGSMIVSVVDLNPITSVCATHLSDAPLPVGGLALGLR